MSKNKVILKLSDGWKNVLDEAIRYNTASADVGAADDEIHSTHVQK